MASTYTVVQAKNTSTVQQERAIRYQPVVADGFTSLVRWRGIDGYALKIPEIGPLDTAGSVVWVDESTRAAPSEALFVQREVGLGRVQGAFTIGRGFVDQYSNETNQAAAQEAMKNVLIGQQMGNVLVDGNRAGGTDEPDGLYVLSDVSALDRRVPGAGGALSTALLDSLLDAVTTNGGMVDFLVMSGPALKAYRQLYKGTSDQHGVPTVRSEKTGRVHCSYAGVPILRDDHIPSTLTPGNATYIVAVNLDALAFIYPKGVGPYGMERAQFLEASEDEVHVRVTQNVGIAVLETFGFAVLEDVTV